MSALWRGISLAAIVALGGVFGASAAAAAAATTNATAGQAFAAQLLKEAVLPPGSQQTPTLISSLLAIEGQPFGFPSSNQYEAHAVYLDSKTPAQVAAYIESHVPHKTWITGNGPPPLGETQIQVRLPVSGPHEQDAQDVYSIVADNTGSEFRLDAWVVWNPSRPQDESVPSNGDVEVTGYSASTLYGGSTGPVRVKVASEAAYRIRQAFDALPLSAPAMCMENEAAYEIAFIPEGHSEPTIMATDELCPSPGEVGVTSDGQAMPTLEADCAVARAVVAALPHGKAAFTRQAASTVCRHQ